ncbi:MAG TPA: pyridoxamine 5'-phosphate oxidase family protein [Candidatus Dojkabacteria bacterium]|nr:pyridoxamine 5'-phosphate oxidase family protein [Candidatus Dojkabacteria bacterium]
MVKIVKKNTKTSDDKILSIILGILKDTTLASMSTVDDMQQPWINTFFFNFDDDLNFYLLTSPQTRHGENIKKNNRVAINIFDSHQKPSDKKKGVFVQGTCEQVVNPIDLVKGLVIYGERFGKIEGIKDVKDFAKLGWESRLYKVVPNYIKLFTEETGEEKYIDIFLK